jgi:hypothetical protein
MPNYNNLQYLKTPENALIPGKCVKMPEKIREADKRLFGE